MDRRGNKEKDTKISSGEGIQIGFSWAPPVVEFKDAIYKNLINQTFTESFLDTILSGKDKTQESRFIQNIIDRDSDLIFIKDQNHRFKMVNASIAGIYGTNHEQLLNKRDIDFNPDLKETEHFNSIEQEVLTTGKERLVSAEAVTDFTGITRTYRTIKVPIINSEGHTTHVLGIATDITAQYESILFRRLLASSAHPAGKMLFKCLHDDSEKQMAVERNGILVVDDDEAVREVTSEILTGAGYEIFQAADGFVGFSVFLENADSIRLVILDMAMPHIDGEELFRQIRKIAPQIPVVVCSGLQEKTVLKNITPDEFLGKPYNPKLLLKVVTKFFA